MGLIVAALAATIALHPGLKVEASEERRVFVEIRKFKFVPETLTVGPGDVIVWKNSDIVPHTATSEDDGWDSSTIAAGDEWTIIVTGGMQGEYYCRFHPSMTANLEIKSVSSAFRKSE